MTNKFTITPSLPSPVVAKQSSAGGDTNIWADPSSFRLVAWYNADETDGDFAGLVPSIAQAAITNIADPDDDLTLTWRNSILKRDVDHLQAYYFGSSGAGGVAYRMQLDTGSTKVNGGIPPYATSATFINKYDATTHLRHVPIESITGRNSQTPIAETVITGSHIKITGDYTGAIEAGDKLFISGSASNNGVYTVVSRSYAGGLTDIVVTEAIPADTTLESGSVLYWGHPILTLRGNRGINFPATATADIINSDDLSLTGVVFSNSGGKVLGTYVTHTLVTGDTIAVTGTTNWNGTWRITKIDADTFYLDGAAWSAGADNTGDIVRSYNVTLTVESVTRGVDDGGEYTAITFETPAVVNLRNDTTSLGQLKYSTNVFNILEVFSTFSSIDISLIRNVVWQERGQMEPTYDGRQVRKAWANNTLVKRVDFECEYMGLTAANAYWLNKIARFGLRVTLSDVSDADNVQFTGSLTGYLLMLNDLGAPDKVDSDSIRFSFIVDSENDLVRGPNATSQGIREARFIAIYAANATNDTIDILGDWRWLFTGGQVIEAVDSAGNDQLYYVDSSSYEDTPDSDTTRLTLFGNVSTTETAGNGTGRIEVLNL